MIEPQSMHDGASAWVAKATFVPPRLSVIAPPDAAIALPFSFAALPLAWAFVAGAGAGGGDGRGAPGRSLDDRAAVDEPEVRLVVRGQEAAAEPAEDVVHDRLGDRDLVVAGEAGRLEADVGELVDEVAQRHAVLERQADRRRERVH